MIQFDAKAAEERLEKRINEVRAVRAQPVDAIELVRKAAARLDSWCAAAEAGLAVLGHLRASEAWECLAADSARRLEERMRHQVTR